MARPGRLDALEAEIRATRARLGALLARADRDYALRPILRALKRGAGRDLAAPALPAAEAGTRSHRLALPAAMFGFALALVSFRRRRAEEGAEKASE